MGSRRYRFAPYSVQCRSQLPFIDTKSVKAFNLWKDEYIKDSTHSRLEDLPSSQLPKLESQVSPTQKQLFAVIDTCSLIRHHNAFVKFVTELRRCYRGTSCPLRFVIPIEVLEELDKCNRPTKKRRPQKFITLDQQRPYGAIDENRDCPPVGDILDNRDPPRSFMRIIEEELRVFQIIVPDFDPGHTINLPLGNLRGTEDNSILGSCRRAQIYIDSIKHHPETRVILVTEDNLFKTKATAFGLPSFRWLEFVAKFHNFGRKNYTETPVIPVRQSLHDSTLTGKSQDINSQDRTEQSTTPKLKVEQKGFPKLEPLAPFSNSQDANKISGTDDEPMILDDESHIGKILPTKSPRPTQTGKVSTMKSTSIKIKRMSNANCQLISTLVGEGQGSCSSQDDISIIKEVITVE